MTVIEYLNNCADRWPGQSIYTCKITKMSFGYEDTDMHMDYLKRNKLI